MPAPVIDEEVVIHFMADGYWRGGSSLVLTYSAGGGSWSGYGVGDEPSDAGYSVFNTTQRDAFFAGMELWDSYVAAEFNESTSGPGQVRVAFTGIADDGVWGYAYVPFSNNALTKNVAGDIWVDEDYAGSDFEVGSYDFSALLHEIGHAIGLDHSFRETGEPPSEGLPSEYDNTRYSIMSYTDIEDYWFSYFIGTSVPLGRAAGVNPITPMMFDILVVQDLYGVSTTTRTGATTYEFDADVACLQTIFDSGGVDTWDLGGHARRSIIDLREASFSSIDLFPLVDQVEYWVDIYGEEDRATITDWIMDPEFISFAWEDNVAISYDTIIENVICGNANDSVTGNSAANVFEGRAGADKLNGAGGADTLIGGIGKDTLTGGAGADKFVLNAAASPVNADTFKDFTSGTDKIHLENSVFAGIGLGGNLAAAKFWAGVEAHDATDRIIYDSGSGSLYYDADGAGGVAQVKIATLTGAPALALALSDLVVI